MITFAFTHPVLAAALAVAPTVPAAVIVTFLRGDDVRQAAALWTAFVGFVLFVLWAVIP